MRRQQTNFERLMGIRHMTVEQVIYVLRIKNLLATSVSCDACSESMVERKKNSVDGFCWICDNKYCSQYRNTKSIRTNSFFEGFKLSLSDVFTIIILLPEGKQFKDMISDYGFKRDTLTKTISKLRLTVKAFFAADQVRLGGPGRICQIDESQFVHKVKHLRGRAPSSDVWVFGIADASVSPARCYMEIVPNRSAETLLPIIRRVCRPGTIIHSDGWAAYANIERELSFQHKIVNHKHNFVDPVTGTHTQNIESFWNKMKRVTKAMQGASKIQLPGLIAELMFKDEFKGNVLLRVVALLAIK